MEALAVEVYQPIHSNKDGNIPPTTHSAKTEYEAIPGLGEAIITSLADFASQQANCAVIDKLQNSLKILNTEGNSKGNLESGKPSSKGSIVFTGKLTAMTRSEAEALAKSHGYKPVKTISKNLNILVAGEKAGSKLQKASQLGIKVLNENEWHNFLKEKI